MYSTGYELTEEQSEVLGIWQEEAAEVIQELSKLRRSGPDFGRKGTDVTNMVHLQHEVLDFMILMDLAIETGLFEPPSEAMANEYWNFKHEKLKKWSKLGNAVQRIQERNSIKHA